MGSLWDLLHEMHVGPVVDILLAIMGNAAIRLRLLNRDFAKFVQENDSIPLSINRTSLRNGIIKAKQNPGLVTLKQMFGIVGPLIKCWNGPIRLAIYEDMFFNGNPSLCPWLTVMENLLRYDVAKKKLKHLDLDIKGAYSEVKSETLMMLPKDILGGALHASLRSLTWAFPRYTVPPSTCHEILSKLTLLPELEELRLSNVNLHHNDIDHFADIQAGRSSRRTFMSLKTLKVEAYVFPDGDDSPTRERHDEMVGRSFTSGVWPLLGDSLKELTLAMDGGLEIQLDELARLVNLETLYLSGSVTLVGDLERFHLENLVDLCLEDASVVKYNTPHALQLFLRRVLSLRSLKLRSVICTHDEFVSVAVAISNMTQLEVLTLDNHDHVVYRTPLHISHQDLALLNLGGKPHLREFVAWGHTQ
jgi:hypothetical protein